MAGMWVEAEWLHKTFVVAALPFALIALRSGSATVLIRGLIVAGFGVLALGAFYEPLHDHEVGLTVLGGVLLATGHGLRWMSVYRASQA